MLNISHCHITSHDCEIYAYCSSTSRLFDGPFTVLSQEGPQQGNLLVPPLLFANIIQPLPR